jgi:hypothetical protein
MQPSLTELEDRLLCMADEEWTQLGTAKAVLESWFASPLDTAQVGRLLSTLLAHGLVSCTVKSRPVDAEGLHLPDDLDLVEYKTTGQGLRYLAENKG